MLATQLEGLQQASPFFSCYTELSNTAQSALLLQTSGADTEGRAERMQGIPSSLPYRTVVGFKWKLSSVPNKHQKCSWWGGKNEHFQDTCQRQYGPLGPPSLAQSQSICNKLISLGALQRPCCTQTVCSASAAFAHKFMVYFQPVVTAPMTAGFQSLSELCTRWIFNPKSDTRPLC